MKCKYSIGNFHVWTGELKNGESHSNHVSCGDCERSSGEKSFKEQFNSLYDWARKIYGTPSVEDKDYYLGFSQGIKTVLAILGDNFDVYDTNQSLIEEES